jgi:hypothetical protein
MTDFLNFCLEPVWMVGRVIVVLWQAVRTKR